MPRNVWAKVWCDFLRHPRFRRRPDCDVRLALGLILYAKEYAPGDGIVRDLDAETMRSMFGISAPLTKVQEGLEYFLRCGWLEHADEQGGLRIKDFVRRQAGETAADDEGNKRPKQVYFIVAGGSGRIKIGCSNNPWARLNTLQTGSSETLRLVAMQPGGEDEERALHQRFKHLRANREWFNPGQELLAYVATVAATKVQRGSATGSTTPNPEVAEKAATSPKLPSLLRSQLQQEEEEEEEKDHDRSAVDGESEGKSSQALETVDRHQQAIASLSESDRLRVTKLLTAGKAAEATALLAELSGAQVPEKIQRKAGAQ